MKGNNLILIWTLFLVVLVSGCTGGREKYNAFLLVASEENPDTGGYDNAIWMVDLNENERKKILTHESLSFYTDIRHSPSGKILFIETDGKTMWLSDLKSKGTSKLVSITNGSLSRPIINDDGKFVAYLTKFIAKPDSDINQSTVELIQKYELVLLNLQQQSSRVIDSKETKSVFSYDTATAQFSIISAERIYTLIPIKFSKDNKKLFTINSSHVLEQDEEWKLSIIDLSRGKSSQFNIPSGGGGVSISPDDKKAVVWRGNSTAGMLDLINFKDGTSNNILKRSNFTSIVGWLSNDEIIIKTLPLYDRGIHGFEFGEASYKIFNIVTNKEKSLFTTSEKGIENDDEILIDNKVVYYTNGKFSTPQLIAELFIIDIDDFNKKKIDEVKGALNILGPIY